MVLPAWAAAGSGTRPGGLPLGDPYLVAPLSLVLGAVLGATALSRSRPDVLSSGLAGCVGALALSSFVSSGAGGGVLGYANANAALAIQVMAMCGLARLNSAGSEAAWLLRGSALLCFAVVLVNQSRVGVALGAAVLLASLATRPVRHGVRAGMAAVATLGTVSTAAFVVGSASGHGWASGLPFPDDVRADLWRQSIVLWGNQPWHGSGPGAFARVVPAAADPDLSSSHSVLLQVGAETGLVGAAALALVVLGGVLLALRGGGGPAVLGVLAWAALAAHAMVDHLVEFPPVVLTAGLVIGWASSQRSSTSPIVSTHDFGAGGPAARARAMSTGP